MKKILSILLTFTILLSSVCFSVSAETKSSLEKQRLYVFIDTLEIHASTMGAVDVYSLRSGVYEEAYEVYYNEDSTDEDYARMADELLDSWLNQYIIIDYAIETYENALEEQNYNNWYSEEEWSDFQEALGNLGDAIDNLDDSVNVYRDKSSEVSEAFFAMLKAYNKMTTSYTLKGDLNKDGVVNVTDVTLLQKYLAGTENLTGAQKILTGAARYENPRITDATNIQKYAVGIIDEFTDYSIDYDIFIDDIVDELPADCMDHDLMMERVFNYNICPRFYSLPVILRSSGFYYLYNYYYWCYQNNYYQ